MFHVDIDQAMPAYAADPIYIKGDACILSICLSVCLSICLYHHSGQTCGWISLKLGMTIGFDPT